MSSVRRIEPVLRFTALSPEHWYLLTDWGKATELLRKRWAAAHWMRINNIPRWSNCNGSRTGN